MIFLEWYKATLTMMVIDAITIIVSVPEIIILGPHGRISTKRTTRNFRKKNDEKNGVLAQPQLFITYIIVR